MAKNLMMRLGELFPQAKKTTLREMVEHKRVRVNGTVVRRMSQPVEDTDKVVVAESGDDTTKTVILYEGLRLIHFDADIIIVDKPSGQLTATDAQEKRPTTWRILQDYFGNQNHKFQVHLVHRLDRDASGLLVFARTWEAFSSLKKQFFEHTINRQYDAIVHGIPKKPKGRLEDLLLEDDFGIVRVTKDLKNGKLAILDYQTVTSSKEKDISHVRCTLFTGRKHQIRVQLNAMGNTVCADALYSRSPKPPEPNEPPFRLALHAARLSFEHPRTKKTVSFESPMPGAMAHLFHA